MFLIVGSNPIPFFELRSKLISEVNFFSNFVFLSFNIFSISLISVSKYPSPSNLKKNGTDIGITLFKLLL